MAEDAHEEFPEHPGYAEATALYRAARAAGRDRRDAYRDAAERAASEHGPPLLAAALTAWAYPAQPAHTVCRTGPSASPAFVTELSAAPVATPGTATRRYAELDEREMQPSARALPQERVSVHRVSGSI